jgi:hypothetical protein
VHPLQEVIAESEGFVLIGDSSADRFPGLSYNAYTKAGKSFHCLDLGGLKESRGPTKGGPVYSTVAELPSDRDDLAVIWVKPGRAKEAVELAQRAGCRRIWFSFQTGHRDAVARAIELGLEVIEIGRCPIYYMDSPPTACAAHKALTKVTGTWAKPPQLDPTAKRRELW